jgi:hypothetical protein
MGTAVFTAANRLIGTDEQYIHEIKEKCRLLNEDHLYYQSYSCCLAQWDVVDKVLHDLVLFESGSFVLNNVLAISQRQ